jgi:hypothetical protein
MFLGIFYTLILLLAATGSARPQQFFAFPATPPPDSMCAPMYLLQYQQFKR